MTMLGAFKLDMALVLASQPQTALSLSLQMVLRCCRSLLLLVNCLTAAALPGTLNGFNAFVNFESPFSPPLILTRWSLNGVLYE